MISGRPPENFEEVVVALLETPRHVFGHVQGLLDIFRTIYPDSADWAAANDAIEFVQRALIAASEDPEGYPLLRRVKAAMPELKRSGIGLQCQ